MSRWNGWVTLAWIAVITWGGLIEQVPRLPVVGMTPFLEALGHLLQPMLLAPLAADWLVSRGSFPRVRAALISVILGTALALAVEAVQLFRPGRSVEALDLALGIVGAAIGAGAYLAATTSERSVPFVSKALTVLGSIAVLALASAILTQPADRTECLGSVATPRQFEPGETVRADDGLLLEYRFEEGRGQSTVSSDGELSPFPLTLEGETAWLSGGPGIVFDGDESLLRSEETASALAEAVLSTTSFTIEAWVDPDDLQEGPARIVSISSSGSLDDIDLQLGQEGPCASHRIRFGSFTEWVLVDGAFAPAGEQHVAVSFSEGNTSTWMNGQLIDTHAAAGDSPRGWDPTHHLLIGNEATADKGYRGEVFLVAIYDRALTAREVSANYAAGPRPGLRGRADRSLDSP